MGRTKPNLRMPSLIATGHKSAAPDEIDHAKTLIDYLESLPDTPPSDESTDEIPGPPAKRARTGHGLGTIPIVSHELSFETRSATSLPQSTHVYRRGVGKHLNVWHSIRGANSAGPPGPNNQLKISPKPRPKSHPFCVCHTLDVAQMPKTLITALHVAKLQGSDPESEGCLWASIDIDARQDGAQIHVKLTINVYWNESRSVSVESRKRPQQVLRDDVLETCFPGLNYNPKKRIPDWTPKDFYDASHVPDNDKFDPGLLRAEIPNLIAELFPFQRRSINWLLNREGVSWAKAVGSDESHIQPLDLEQSSADEPISFIAAQDALGKPFYISPLFGVVARDPSRYLPLQNIKGGILAEEMGLGKTLEIIGLLLLHHRPDDPPLVFDPFLGQQLRPTGATLIITPQPLLDQWRTELARHAPHLNVMYYPGLRASTAKDKQSEADLVDELGSQDVVLTTYDALRPEIHMAIDPPARSMRGERKYERLKSPLVQLSWWRVCIDEAQMMENWTTNTAVLARLIPRVNVWAITGTPVKDDIQQDLRGLLTFLRFEPYASDTKIWNSLFSLDKETFHRVFNLISLRHTKGLVRNEIALPPQKRYVITMPFSAVEEQHYQSLFKDLAKACGLDTRGNPIQEGWDSDHPAIQETMRMALDRLRQTALHPEVGAHNRRALGHRAGPMRTVSEVLDAMLEQSESAIRTDQRSLLNTRLTRGQILASLGRVKDALAVWEDVLKSSTTLVADCKAQLEQEVNQAWNQGADPSETDTEDDDDEGGVQGQLSEARRRLRYALEIQHKAVFFCANAYYTIKSDQDMTAPESDEFNRLEKKETESYDFAKLIRKEILQDTHSRAKRLMDRIASAASQQAFAVIPEFKSIDQKGIESRTIVDAFDNLCEALDAQANQLDEWREHVIQLLLKPLVDEEGEEITGEEYDESTKLQDEIEVYVRVLRTAVADRQDALSGQKNNLVDLDYNVAIRQAEEGEGPFPEKLLELFKIRDSLKPQSIPGDALGSLRGIVSALRTLSVKLRHDAASGSQRASVELGIVTNQLQLTQRQMTEQIKVTGAIGQEIQRCSDTMNARLEFYRQLQAVSDMVADYEGDKTDNSLETLSRQEDAARRALESAESKHRYLLHLRDADSGGEEQRLCIICQSTFSIGVLTICGHQFCKECISLWFRAHHNCPVCKRKLSHANLHDITLKPKELKIHSDTSGLSRAGVHSTDTSPSKKTSIYTEFSAEKLAEINNIDLEGPNFTTKVDTLVRHLLWLRDSDPGAKSIVFSQYKDFLDVLALAFQRHGIGYTAFDKANGISSFKEDPGVEVFLLHARAHSSGLNLVNASHVFLCEPLLNTALELQAIARVDRIGQEHETTVWLYIVDGTVEESIYNLSVQRRMEHIGQSLKGKSKESTPELIDARLEVANSLELEQAHLSKLMGKGGISGEAVDKSDLWTCLFGHVKPGGQDDEQIRDNPAVRGFLAAEAAEGRRDGLEGNASCMIL